MSGVGVHVSKCTHTVWIWHVTTKLYSSSLHAHFPHPVSCSPIIFFSLPLTPPPSLCNITGRRILPQNLPLHFLYLAIQIGHLLTPPSHAPPPENYALRSSQDNFFPQQMRLMCLTRVINSSSNSVILGGTMSRQLPDVPLQGSFDIAETAPGGGPLPLPSSVNAFIGVVMKTLQCFNGEQTWLLIQRFIYSYWILNS